MGRARKNPTSRPVDVADMPDSALGVIHHGDCIATMRELPSNSVHLAFADPPFNIGYDYDEYDDRLDSEKYLEWSAAWMSEIHRVLCANGAFWLAIGDEYAAELKITAQKLGFTCRSWVIWYYTFGVHCTAKFTRSHAHIFHFVKDAKNFVFNASEVKVPSARQLVYNDTRAAQGGRLPDDTWILRPQDCVDGFQPDEDTWYFPRVAGTFKERAGFHGCQMPEQLLGRIIRVSSHPNDIVLDPFAGSASTLITAKKLGRRFLGCELSADYREKGIARLMHVSAGDELDGAEDPKLSAPRTGVSKRLKRKPSPQLFGFRDRTTTLPDRFGDFAEALVAAFSNTCNGFSVDRVLADPVFNEDFQTECDRTSVPGTQAERNRLLFRLRKAGVLKRAGIHTVNETTLSPATLHQFQFASEIAWRQIEERYQLSLDDILIDPRVAREFDLIASAFAPGFSPVEYRLGALRLRKERKISDPLNDAVIKEIGLRKFKRSLPLDDLKPASVPEGPGVYGIAIVDARPHFLFAGEAPDLAVRLQAHFGTEEQKQKWRRGEGNVAIFMAPIADIQDIRKPGRLVQMRKRLCKWYHPEWNINWLS